MDAWSARAGAGARLLEGRTPLERQGALVFQAKQCRNCHALGDAGGQRGPALDDVATRLTRDQLIRQVLQGGGNMPAYGKNLRPAETTALVAFLETLHPPKRAAGPRRGRAARAARRARARTMRRADGAADPSRVAAALASWSREPAPLGRARLLAGARLRCAAGALLARLRRDAFPALARSRPSSAGLADALARRRLAARRLRAACCSAVHMVQHLLLMMVAPPLLLLGAPLVAAAARAAARGRPRCRSGRSSPGRRCAASAAR